jgi:hypothetical protein
VLLHTSYSYIIFFDFRVIITFITRKTYTVHEELGIIDKEKRDDSKANLFRELGVPEGVIRSWAKEEDKVLDSFSEVMNWMERQSDCVHLHLLHLQYIKTYVAKKWYPLSHQKKTSDIKKCRSNKACV